MTLIIYLLSAIKLITRRQFKEINFFKNWVGKSLSSKVTGSFALSLFWLTKNYVAGLPLHIISSHWPWKWCRPESAGLSLRIGTTLAFCVPQTKALVTEIILKLFERVKHNEMLSIKLLTDHLGQFLKRTDLLWAVEEPGLWRPFTLNWTVPGVL